MAPKIESATTSGASRHLLPTMLSRPLAVRAFCDSLPGLVYGGFDWRRGFGQGKSFEPAGEGEDAS